MFAIAGGIILAFYLIMLIGGALTALGNLIDHADESLNDLAKKFSDRKNQ